MPDSYTLKFRNEPATDFANPALQSAMTEALKRVRQQQNLVYPLLIDGKKVKGHSLLKSVNPSKPRELVGIVHHADTKTADKALETATKAFPSWSQTPAWKRAEVLRRMAALLRKRKMEFCAWLVYEVGKNWTEADADAAEAIDFLAYYAELALVPPPVLTPIPGEKNTYHYRPLGPVVVIPPWNFPLAILVGMTSAALVAGNPVVLKPSSQSPVIAVKFTELAWDAGLPIGALTLLPGAGGAIGDFLVKDARTRMIAFTGSRSVGLRIQTLAGQTAKGQKWIKRVIAEMGGKNAIIVDESADLEAAAQGVLASAFGYQGQKCSACSRLFVHQAVYEAFLDCFLSKIQSIRQGLADDRENFMGPVISADALKKIQYYNAIGKKEGRSLVKSFPSTPGDGYFIAPAVFDRLPKTSRLFHEEIFGPVLAVDNVKNFDEALVRANASEYGLTGAVYSHDPEHLEQARHHFFCGNLYLNRKCTGALVGGHPFGGFNMSGTDSKAGGPDYLSLFTQAKCISEK